MYQNSHTANTTGDSASNLNSLNGNNINQVEIGINNATATTAAQDLLVISPPISSTAVSIPLTTSLAPALAASDLLNMNLYSQSLVMNQTTGGESYLAAANMNNAISTPNSSSLSSTTFSNATIHHNTNNTNNLPDVVSAPEAITSSSRINLKRNASEEIPNNRSHPSSSALQSLSTAATSFTPQSQSQSQFNSADMVIDINSVEWGKDNDLSGLIEAAAAASNSVASTSIFDGGEGDEEDAEGELEEDEEEEFKPKATAKAKGKGKAKSKTKSKSSRSTSNSTPKRGSNSLAHASNSSPINSNLSGQQPTLIRTSQISLNDIQNSTPVELRVLFDTTTSALTALANVNATGASATTSASAASTSLSTLSVPALTSSLAQDTTAVEEATKLDEDQDDLNKMALNWSNEEWTARRRLVQIFRVQDQNIITMRFKPISQLAYDTLLRNGADQEELVVISCIYRDEWNECFVTSVDAIWLLERLILGIESRSNSISSGTLKSGKGKAKVLSAGAKIIGGSGETTFSVEEKNRIRRNLEGFKPFTVSKTKSTGSHSLSTASSTSTANPTTASSTTNSNAVGAGNGLVTTEKEMENFFKLIMSYKEPKPRKIEKDLKVFPWKTLSDCLEKILSKFSAITPNSTINPNTLVGASTTSPDVPSNTISSVNPTATQSSPQVVLPLLMNQNAARPAPSQSSHQQSQQPPLLSLDRSSIPQQAGPLSHIPQQPISNPQISIPLKQNENVEMEGEKDIEPTKSLEDLFEESSTNWDLSSLPLPLRSNRDIEE